MVSLNYVRRKRVANLLEKGQYLEVRRFYILVRGGPPQVKIESMDDIKRLLEIHPDSQKGSVNTYENYFGVRGHPDLTVRELAKKFGIQASQAGEYRKGKEPFKIAQLRRLEERRIIMNWFVRLGFKSQYRGMAHSDPESTNKPVLRISQSVVETALATPNPT